MCGPGKVAAGLILLAAVLGTWDGARAETKPYYSREECIENGEKLLGDIGVLLEDQDAVSCASGAGEACCRALTGYFGEDSNFWGCPCYQDLFSEALENIPTFARPLVEQRLVECGIPTPTHGCTNVQTASVSENSTEPQFGQTSTMSQFSGPWSFAEKGFDSYGEWFPCAAADNTKYCVSLLSPPGVFSETKWGVCVPDTMNETSIDLAIVNSNPDYFDSHPPKTYCNLLQKLPNWTPGAIGVTALLCFLALMVVVGTACGYLNRVHGVFTKGTALYEITAAFDVMPNWKILVSSPSHTEGEVDLRSLNGLRSLSMFWIILGHTGSGLYFNYNLQYYSYWAFNPENYKFLKAWFFPLYAGLFGVDSFLFISGLLVAYKFSQQMAKRASRETTWKKELYFWVMYVFARWLRLIPVLLVVMFASWKLVGNLSTAPGWSIFWDANFNEPCNKYWWATLLFIQNLYPGGESFGNKGKFCFGISWYLAVDMQLYLFVAPLVLIAWHYGFYSACLRKAKRGLGSFILAALFIASMASTAYIVVHHKVMWQFLGVGDFDRYYIKPWTRAPPYLFGLLLGLILYEFTQEKDRKSLRWLQEKAKTWALALVWMIALTVLLLLTFTPTFYLQSPEGTLPALSENTGAGMSEPATHTYMTLRYFGWGMCLFVLFGINAVGRGWFVNDLLSGYIWAPIAKLTYCAYLITYVVQDVVTQSLITHPVYHNAYTTLSYWVAFICGGYFFSFLCYMAVEAPFGNMLRLVLKGFQGGSNASNESMSGMSKPCDSIKSPRSEIGIQTLSPDAADNAPGGSSD